MASSKLPWTVRATDTVHRLTVLGLFGICVVGIGGMAFNVWANSDYSKMNQRKITFDKQQYDEVRQDEKEQEKKN